MKKIIGIIVIVLLIPVVIVTISDIDKTPIYPTTEFNLEKLTRISSIDIENGIELPKMPNGVGDRWLSDGTIQRNIGRILFNDNSSFKYHSGSIDIVNELIRFDFTDILSFGGTSNDENLTALSNIFIQSTSVVGTNLVSERFYIISSGSLRIIIDYNKLIPYGFDIDDTSTYNNAMKGWLSDNNVVIYYQLSDPIIENAPILPEYIDFYDGGSVIVDDGIIDYTVVGNQAQINYIEGNITTVTDGQFNISKPTKIISKSNDLYDYDISTLPNYLEYGTLTQDTYNNTLELINNNQNKQIKIFFDGKKQDGRYNIYLENDVIIINNDTEVIRIYNDNSYTSTRNLDTDLTYKLEGYNIIGYIDGRFDNTVLAFFWVIPVLLVGGLIYLALKRKE